MGILDRLNYKKRQRSKAYEDVKYWEKLSQSIQKNIHEASLESNKCEKLSYELNRKGFEDTSIQKHREHWNSILQDLNSQLEIVTFYHDQSMEKLNKLGGMKAIQKDLED